MERKDINKKYKWDLTKIYKDTPEYKKDIAKVKELVNKIVAYENAELDENSIYELLNLLMSTSKVLDRLDAYTGLLADIDTSNNKNQVYKEEIANLVSEFRKKTYFVDINILKLYYKDIEEFYEKNSKLREYEIYLKKLFRYKKYTLSDAEEKLIAAMGKALGNSYDTYELLKDSDLSFPDFNVGGKDYHLNVTNYSLYIESNNRELRKAAFTDLYLVYKQYKNVFASLINTDIKESTVFAEIRGYESAIASFLYRDELDIKIHDNLVDVVRKRLNVLYDYYELKKKMLKLDELHLYDVYANLVDDNSFKYPFEEAKETVIKALSVFGDEYISVLKNGIDNGWIDVYPSKGKRTGGYSIKSYDIEPYILLNYQDKYDDMSTLAHELGHSMHSHYAMTNNPYQYGYYAIFVAEVASTVNELLLAKYVVNNSKNREEKLFILNRMLELFKATIYRQTMFSEFERKIYDKVQNDEPLTADILGDIYYDLNKVYFGNGVVVDDEVRYEWERIPHFYYNFYLYKYATGLSAAASIVTRLLDGSLDPNDYINFLKCGGSKNPIDSLKVAGVDLTDKSVISSAIDMFESILDEFKKEIKK